MPTRRLPALSACSKLGRLAAEAAEVALERKLAALAVVELAAGGPEALEELQHQRAGEPQRVEGIDAAYVGELAVDRRHLHRAVPAAFDLVRPADADRQRDLLAFGGDGDDFEG